MSGTYSEGPPADRRDVCGSAVRMIAVVGAMTLTIECGAVEPEPFEFDRVVQQLNAPTVAARDDAEKTLRDRGPAILPRVIAARARAVGEAAFRLRDIQRGLEQAATAEAVEQALDTLAVAVEDVTPLGDGSSVRITLRASWGPMLVPLAIRLPMRSIVADGPAGESMPPAQRLAIIEPAVTPRTTLVTLPVVLSQPEHRLEALASLRGTLALWIAGREHEFVIPLTGEVPRSLHVGGATVTLTEQAVRKGKLHITAAVAYDKPSEALASHRPWLAERTLEVVDDEGMPLPRVEQSTAARSDRGIAVTAEFSLPAPSGSLRTAVPAHARLRWRLPMAIHEIPFDFTVRDVPLPAGASKR